MNDVLREGEWRNSDNYPLVNTHWSKQQPDNGGIMGKDEDCVKVSHESEWHDEKCQEKMQFVCQKKGA